MDNNNSHKYLPLNNYNNDNTYKLLVNVKKN